VCGLGWGWGLGDVNMRNKTNKQPSLINRFSHMRLMKGVVHWSQVVFFGSEMLSLGDIKNTVETCSKDFFGKKSPKLP